MELGSIVSTKRISGHVNTIESESLSERRRRQRYSEEFKAQVVAACQGIGVSVAAVALEHRLNANLLRRWIDQAKVDFPGGRWAAHLPRHRRCQPLCQYHWEHRIRTRPRSALRFAVEVSRSRLAGQHQRQHNAPRGCASGSRDPH